MGGTGSGFSLISKTRSAFVYSKKHFYGASAQTPFRWHTILEGAFLFHQNEKAIPNSYKRAVERVSSTIGGELVLKKPVFKVFFSNRHQMKVYGKGGFLGAFAKLYSSKEATGNLLPSVGPLVGLGVQGELLSGVLVDVSVNGLYSVFKDQDNAWYLRVAVGPRLYL